MSIDKWDKICALGSASVEMESSLKERYRQLAEFEAHGMEEAVIASRNLIASAEQDLAIIKAMREAMK